MFAKAASLKVLESSQINDFSRVSFQDFEQCNLPPITILRVDSTANVSCGRSENFGRAPEVELVLSTVPEESSGSYNCSQFYHMKWYFLKSRYSRNFEKFSFLTGLHTYSLQVTTLLNTNSQPNFFKVLWKFLKILRKSYAIFFSILQTHKPQPLALNLFEILKNRLLWSSFLLKLEQFLYRIAALNSYLENAKEGLLFK